MPHGIPILYSFRRCPYAMRARLALLYAGVAVELREVVLKQKPAAMLQLSPKGTVPVLQLPSGKVIDESIDIMRWALAQRDVDCWWPACATQQLLITQLIEKNDKEFKPWLDRYKYADRHPESASYYRAHGEHFMSELEEHLVASSGFLVGNTLTLADIAIVPFVRQFAAVDQEWFAESHYVQVRQWLTHFLASPLFAQVMKKYQPWQPGDQPIIFG